MNHSLIIGFLIDPLFLVIIGWAAVFLIAKIYLSFGKEKGNNIGEIDNYLREEMQRDSVEHGFKTV